MRIAVVTNSITRSAGGLLDAVIGMFSNPTFSSRVVVLSYKDKYLDEDLKKWKSVCVKTFKPGFFLYSSKLRNVLLSLKVDVYHQEGLWRYPHLLMAQWAEKIKKPIVCTPHGMLDPWIIKKQGRLKRIISNLFFQKSLESVSCYQALCIQELKDIRAYGLKQPIAVIPNGVNLPDRNIKYSLNDNKKHLLYLGRLHKKKGVDLLIQAFADIKISQPDLINNWIVDIVGWDHEHFQKKLVEMIDLNNLHDFVKIHGGLFGKDKDRMYATCSAYILPSHGEGLPMTVLEAWSWGKPVLITPACHLPEGLEANAALMMDDNVNSVSQALVQLFSMNESELKEMGERGFELVKNDFNWDLISQKLLHVYEWLLGMAEKPDYVYE